MQPTIINPNTQPEQQQANDPTTQSAGRPFNNTLPDTAPTVVSSAPYAPPSQSTVTDSIAPSKPKHGKRTFAIIGVGGVVVVALIVGGYFGYGSMSKANAMKQSQGFVADLNRGDTKAAYAMGSDTLKKGQTEAQFADSLGDLRASKPVNIKETIDIQGKTATYIATQKGLPEDVDGKTTGTFTVGLVKSGLMSWKVDSVEVN